MRITFVLPTLDLTGGVRVVAIYAERLQQRGHQVTAVAPRPRPLSLRDRLRSLVKKGDWPAQPDHAPSHFDGLPVEVRRLPHCGPVTAADVPEADIVIATWWETAEWIERLPPAKGKKVHFVQDYETWGGPIERIDAVYRSPMPKIIIAAWLRELLEKKFNRTPLALVSNSVDPAQFYAPPRGKQPIPTVGMIYAPVPVKGCDIIIKAYELARGQIPNLRLLSCGNLPPTPELPLPPTTEFTLRARDAVLRGIYSSCDAWLFGTRVEGFGLPILEAMACRTPVIGTPAGAAPELLAKGGGILVPPENPPAMAEAIIKICRMPEPEWRSLSDTALATATGFTWEDATNQFEAALARVR